MRNLRYILIPLFIFFVLNLTFHYNSFRNGILHPEAEALLLNYTDHREFLLKIFDTDYTDWKGFYQGRELSHLIDFLDYNFLAFGLKNGFIYFLSLSFYFGVFLLTLFFVMFCKKYLELHNVTTTLLTILFLTSSSLITSGGIYRSSKMGVGVSLMGLLLLLYKRYLGDKEKCRADFFLIFFASLISILFDRLGAYLIIAAIIVLYFLPQNHGFNRWKTISILLASTFTGFIYNYFIAPHIILNLTGQFPSFAYEGVSYKRLIFLSPYYFINGLYLFYYNIKYLAGNSDTFFVALIMGYFYYYPITKYDIIAGNNHIGKYKTLITQNIAILISVLVVVMNSMMFLKHSVIILPDIQRTLYWLPSTVVIIFGFGLFTKTLTSEYGHKPIWLVLVMLVGCNILAIPEHFNVLKNGHLNSYRISTYKEVVPALENANNPNYQTSDKFRMRPIYDFIEREIKKNPDYRLTPPREPCGFFKEC